MSTKLTPESAGLIGPTYARPATRLDYAQRGYDDTADYSAGYVSASRSSLQQTGLRGKKLWAVIACLCILWILALFAFFVSLKFLDFYWSYVMGRRD
uniref:Uncharacterized protein n=1 Tax=Plectus sambesii TaxID=2011161 RepID=A0A914XDW9_9BILA